MTLSSTAPNCLANSKPIPLLAPVITAVIFNP
jgi:hypothetical protein